MCHWSTERQWAYSSTDNYSNDKRKLDSSTEYADIFHMEGEKPTVNNFYLQSVTLNDNTPVYTRNYRLPQSQKTIISGEVNRLLAYDLIEACVSNFNSPLLLVPKKSTEHRGYLRQFGLVKVFSVMDLQAGYHQIPIKRESRKYLAFSSDKGMYQWKVLPFGLSIAPSAFSRMMSLAFSGLSPERCFSYMDDLIVIGYSEKNHVENLLKVFETCRKCNLKLNTKVSIFQDGSVIFGTHLHRPGAQTRLQEISCGRKISHTVR